MHSNVAVRYGFRPRFPIRLATFLCTVAVVLPSSGADKIPPLPDVKTIWAAIKPVALLLKGEFETTKDFESRICAAAHEALGVAKGEIVYVPRHHADYSEWYSADDQKFIFHNPGLPPIDSERYEDQWKWTSADPLNSKKTGSQAVIGFTLRKGPSYSGKNAYGVSTKIDVDNWEEFFLFMPKRPDIAHLEFAATPASAQLLKGDLRVVFSGKLSAPCVVAGKRRSAPTLRKPVESNTALVGLVISDEQWVIYRQSTMEVLKRSTRVVAPKGSAKRSS